MISRVFHLDGSSPRGDDDRWTSSYSEILSERSISSRTTPRTSPISDTCQPDGNESVRPTTMTAVQRGSHLEDDSWRSGGSQKRKRLSAILRIGRRKVIPLLLALSLPFLALLLAQEMKERRRRLDFWARQSQEDDGQCVQYDWTGRERNVDLGRVRNEFLERERDRRRSPSKVGRRRNNPAGRDLEYDEDDGQLVKEASVYWPRWWGNIDDVGPSPFDHRAIVPVEGARRRVLFLTGKPGHA